MRSQNGKLKSRKTNKPPLAFLSICFGSIAGVLLVELMLRLLGIGYGHSPMESDPVLHHAHPKNYSFFSHHPSNEFGGFAVRYDSKGLRTGSKESSKAESTTYRVAFMGDSFVEAYQVVFEESFVGILKSKASKDTTIWNFGVSSYSPAIYYLQIKKLILKYHPTHIFILLSSNDVHDDEKYTSKGLFEEGNLIAIPGPKGGKIVKFLRKSYFARFIRKNQLRLMYLFRKQNGSADKKVGSYLERSPEVGKLTGKYILKVANLVKDSGAEFSLLTVPSKYKSQGINSDPNYISFSDNVMKWASENKINYIDLSRAFSIAANDKKLFFDIDIHFNKEGHKIVAGVIRKQFQSIFN